MVWEFLDEIGEDIEDGAEALGRGMGEVAGKAAHLVGDGLDAIGLHSAAQAVDGFGDDVADALGAQVGESQLGETDDPAKLVHGDVAALTETSGHLAKFGAAFGKTADGLRRIDTAHWTGDAADKFRAQFHQHPTQWSDAAEACTRASGALTAFGAVVKWAQTQAAEAVRLYNQAKQDSARARDAYNRQVDSYNAQAGRYNDMLEAGNAPGTPPAKPGEFADPGIDGLKRAQQLLSDARTRRNAEGDRAKAAMDEATAKAPAEPRFTDRLLDDAGDLVQEGMDGVTHFYGGIVKGAGGILKFGRSLNPLDPYNLTHPAEYAAGLSGTAAGLLHTVNHPMDLVTGMLGDGWGSDPFEAMGKLIPNVALTVATDGAGGAGERVAMAGEEAAESAAMTAGRSAAADAGAIGERTAGLVEPPPVPRPAEDFGSLGDDFGPLGDDFGPAGHDFGPADDVAPAEHPSQPPREQTDWDSFEHEDPLAESPQHHDVSHQPTHEQPSAISSKLDGDQPTHEPPSDISSKLDGHHPSDLDAGHPAHGEHPVNAEHDHPGDGEHGHDGHQADDAGSSAHHDESPSTDHAQPDYAGDPDYRASDADRAKFRDSYANYDEHRKAIEDIIAKHPEYAPVPPEELVGIRGYTTDDYYHDMNQGLRTGDQELIDKYEAHVKSAVSGLNQLPAYEGPVLRGISKSGAELENLLDIYSPGKVVEEPAFFSTDTSKPFPGNVQFDVYSTTGRFIKDLSAHGEESEVLFPPGTKFHVESRAYDAAAKQWRISLTDVS